MNFHPFKRTFNFLTHRNLRCFGSETEGRSSNLVSKLDFDHVSQKFVDNTVKRKLLKPLESAQARDNETISPKSVGLKEAIECEVAAVLNEALQSPRFMKTFRGLHDPSMLVEIEEVKTLGDGSQLLAFWRSEMLDSFISEVRKSKGEDECYTLSKKVAAYYSQRLQRKEPQFRSELIKKIDFRRVPRIIFKMQSNEVNDVRQIRYRKFLDDVTAAKEDIEITTSREPI